MTSRKKNTESVCLMLAYLDLPSTAESLRGADELPEGFTGKQDNQRYVCTVQGGITFEALGFGRSEDNRSRPANIPPTVLTRMRVRLYTRCRAKAEREIVEKLAADRLEALGISPVRRDKP